MDMNKRLQRIEMTVRVDPAAVPPVEDTTQVALWLQAVAATKDLDAMKKAVERFKTVYRANFLVELARQPQEDIPDAIYQE